MNRRLLSALLVVALLAGGAVWWLRRGEAPDDVARDYLDAQWRGRAAEQCRLSVPAWQHVLFNGFPFADCAAFAAAARQADAADLAGSADPADPLASYVRYRADTRVRVDVVERSSDDERARVEYLVRLTYTGGDRAGFDAMWQGSPAEDRGTVELVRDDGAWRVAGVDRG